MSDIVKQVTISKEVDEIMAAVVDLVIAAKEGKLNLVQELSRFISLLGDFAALPEEIRSNLGDSIEAVLLQMARLIDALAGLKND